MEATSTTSSAVHTDVFIKMVLSNWEQQNYRLNKFFDALTDSQFEAEVAPGRNRGIYLLGHLTAVHDSMITLLGLGQKLHPELEEPFIKNGDTPGSNPFSLADLKQYWQEVSSFLTAHFATMPAEAWFTGHSAVSAEDFAKEPHRNKLNIVINRTIHLSYHLGQLIFLKQK
jgi:hypothetical protein